MWRSLSLSLCFGTLASSHSFGYSTIIIMSLSLGIILREVLLLSNVFFFFCTRSTYLVPAVFLYQLKRLRVLFCRVARILLEL